MRMHGTRLVAFTIAVSSTAAGCASAPPRPGATPTAEVAVGFSAPQLPQAEFPGFTGSVALIFPKTSTWGAAVVADVEGSYLIESTTAGPRVFVRTGPLFNRHRTLTTFAQLLMGKATGSIEGVLRSEGGRVIEPGIGFDYGAGRTAFRLQVGYRHVAKGLVYDSRVPGGPTDRLSRMRVVLGMTWRVRPH